MKKQVLACQTFCDDCGKETYGHKCIGCGLEYCYECSKKHLKELKHSVHFGGSGDAEICPECLVKPPEKIKKLLSAYLLINNLRSEHDAWWKEFDMRATKAEQACQIEIKKYEAIHGRV